MTTLAVIIVSWNIRDLLRRCLQTIHASLAGADIPYTIVVVDNASIDGTPAMLRVEHPEALLLEPGRNLGFAGGNNLALRQVLSSQFSVLSSKDTQNAKRKTQNAKLDYVFLLNPDTEVIGDALPRLVRYLDAHPDVAVVGPKLLYPDGSAQPSRRRFPTRSTYFWEGTPLETRWPANPWARRYRCTAAPDDVEQEVDWLVGAALLVRRAAIERAGLLDPGFAMYSEELEWQRRIRRPTTDESRTKNQEPRIKNRRAAPAREPFASLEGNLREGNDERQSETQYAIRNTHHASRIIYLPEAVIIHHEGKSSEQALARRSLDFQRSRLRDARMVYGEHFAAALRLFLRVAYAVELAVEVAKWLLGHKRALRAQRVGMYWRVVRGL